MKLIDHHIMLPTIHTPWAITPLGCLHVDDEGFDEDLYFETVKSIISEPFHYALGVGDYTSLARGHYRKFLQGYLDDEDSKRNGLDPYVERGVRDFTKKYLEPMKGRLWGLAEGNHHWKFDTGETSTQRMCQQLRVPYLEVGSVHRLHFSSRAMKGDRAYVLTMLVHHGDWGGGAATTGGDINSAEKRGQGWDVDIAVFAHTHFKHGWTVPVMSVPKRGNLEIVEKPRAYIRAGSFTKGYIPQCVTYVERKLLRANSLGAVTLRGQFVQSYDKSKYASAKLRLGRVPTGGMTGPPRVRFKVEH